MTTNGTPPLSIRIDDETRAKLNRLAKEQRRTVSQLIRFAIDDYLAAKASA